ATRRAGLRVSAAAPPRLQGQDGVGSRRHHDHGGATAARRGDREPRALPGQPGLDTQDAVALLRAAGLHLFAHLAGDPAVPWTPSFNEHSTRRRDLPGARGTFPHVGRLDKHSLGERAVAPRTSPETRAAPAAGTWRRR